MKKNIFIKKNCHAELYKKRGDEFFNQEGGRLLRDFRVGNLCKVGSPFARTFGNDWWRTTPVLEVLEITEKNDMSFITFKTRNSIYKLITNKDNLEFPKKFEKLSDVEALEQDKLEEIDPL